MKLLNLNDSINQISFGSPKECDRVQTILNKAGISTLEKLCRKTKSELQSIDQIGDVTVERITNNLEKVGLHLGMTDYECKMYSSCRARIMQAREDMANEIERMFKEENDGNIRFIDRDITPEDYGDDDYDDGECCHHITLNVHNNLELPKPEPKPINWEERFYEVAKEEFLRQSRTFSCDEVRVDRAISSASAFIEALKSVQSKEKSN